MNRVLTDKKSIRRVLALLWAFCMVMLLPGIVLATEADGGQEPVTYIERSWNGSEVVETVKTVTDYVEMTPNTSWFEGGKIYVAKGDITVKNRIVCNSHSRLILTDGCCLEAECGLSVDSGSFLQIFGQENNSGELIANKRGTDSTCAAIGGNHNSINSKIEIHGGSVYAYAIHRSYAAAIGGGTYGNGYEIVIYDGYVKANGGSGTAIGKGHGLKTGTEPCNVSIYGGSVNVAVGDTDAAIEATNLTICGGMVNATSTWNCPALRSNNIEISGGTVNAVSKLGGDVLSGKFNFTGGELTAVASGTGKVGEAQFTLGDYARAVYGNSANDIIGGFESGSFTIPAKAKYFKAMPLELCYVPSAGGTITASNISEGSVNIIIGCGALLIGAALGLIFGKKLFATAESKKETDTASDGRE